MVIMKNIQTDVRKVILKIQKLARVKVLTSILKKVLIMKTLKGTSLEQIKMAKRKLPLKRTVLKLKSTKMVVCHIKMKR
jgi:hypothetical protein